jgi:hypothetical protein
LLSLGLLLVQEVVELAVAGGDLAVTGTAALPGRFGGAEELLALEEPLEVLAAAGVCPVAWSQLLRGRFGAADVGRTGG